ncbi:MAG: O-antigen ligase family protein [Hyphomicrobiales bacterium]
MITLEQARPRIEMPLGAMSMPRAPVARLADGFLHAMLYLTILSGFFVFVQPAPYEYLAAVLAFAALLARVRLDRKQMPLLLLFLIRDVSGAIALMPILHHDDSFRFLATSFYLGLTAVLFACLFADDTMRRLATLKSAYVMSGVIASILGSLGYFQLYFPIYPGLEIFSMNDRAVAGFKDPNVLGVFLIPPMMWLIVDFVIDKVRLRHVIASAIMLVGLILAFSRAAWGSFAFTTMMTLGTIFLTQPSGRTRKRIIVIVLLGTAFMAVIAAGLMSVEVVNKMLFQRAGIQQYDLEADGGRFNLQQNSIKEILVNPMGMGPWGFSKIYGMVSHNTFLGTLLNHGWVGGFAYILQVLMTLWFGLRAALVRTPWQTFLIATYFTFVALVLEAFVVDTDHWRHYYVLQGIIWGLVVATMNFSRQRQQGQYA